MTWTMIMLAVVLATAVSAWELWKHRQRLKEDARQMKLSLGQAEEKAEQAVRKRW